jgi:hypothetical protein
MAKSLPSEAREEFRVVVEPFLRRKLELFPNFHRTIVNYELTWTKKGPHVSVLYSLD